MVSVYQRIQCKLSTYFVTTTRISTCKTLYLLIVYVHDNAEAHTTQRLRGWAYLHRHRRGNRFALAGTSEVSSLRIMTSSRSQWRQF